MLKDLKKTIYYKDIRFVWYTKGHSAGGREVAFMETLCRPIIKAPLTGVDKEFFQGEAGGGKKSVCGKFEREAREKIFGPPLKKFYEGQSQICFIRINF